MRIFAAAKRTKTMKMNTRWMLTAILLLCSLLSVQAQIPAEVTDMMRKCKDNMTHASGIEMDMKIHMSMMVMSVDMNFTVMTKGSKLLMKTSMKKLGNDIRSESGFDGEQVWEFKHVELAEKFKKEGKEYKDTLTITKTTKAPSKRQADIDFGLAEDYQKATVKKDGRYTVITFTKPKDKDNPKKVTVKVDHEKMLIREIVTKEGIAKITMTVTRVKYGVSDNVFMLDTSKYPGAVIVRK